MKIIVVGGNAAGPAAAAKAKRVNPAADVKLFEAGDFISTGTCEIPYVLSGDIKDHEQIIFYTPVRFKEEKGADVFVNHFVEEIHPKEKFILVKNIKQNKQIRFDYNKLVLATGSIPNKLPALPPTLANVFNLTKIKDLVEIKDFIKKNKVKNIAIIGSGYIGLEAADGFHSVGYQVTIFEKEKMPLPVTEPEMQYLILDEIKKKDIPFYSGFSKLKVNYDEDRVASLNIDGRLLEFDLLISAVGFQPNNSLAAQSKLKIGRHGGISVDRRLKSSDQNIFAAGDNIEVINAVTNQSDYLPFAAIAHQYGHAAGENAAGGNIVVEPVVKNSAIKIFNKYLVTVGITSQEALANKLLFDSVYNFALNLIGVMPESEKTYGKIIYEKGSKRILGASFYGGRETEGFGNLISAMIKLKQPVTFLGTLNYNYTPPLSPFINLLSVLGRKASS